MQNSEHIFDIRHEGTNGAMTEVEREKVFREVLNGTDNTSSNLVNSCTKVSLQRRT